MLFPIFHIDPEMVFNSPWTDVSCTWSLTTLSPFGSSWLSTRYSFRNPYLTKLANWWPKSMHRSTSCPNALWNSHQVSLRDPKFRFVLWSNFSMFTTQAYSKVLYRILKTWAKLLTLPWPSSWSHLSWPHMERTSTSFSSRQSNITVLSSFLVQNRRSLPPLHAFEALS